MGCDIHMFIEYKSKGGDYWYSFGSEIRGNRNYFIFGLLAQGVRSHNPQGLMPKGWPSDAGSSATDGNYLYVTDSKGEYYVTPEIAKKWVEEGMSEYKDENQHFVSNPDWHSHSWLTAEEYNTQIQLYLHYTNMVLYGWKEPEYTAIDAILKHFTEQDLDCRVLFYFDN